MSDFIKWSTILSESAELEFIEAIDKKANLEIILKDSDYQYRVFEEEVVFYTVSRDSYVSKFWFIDKHGYEMSMGRTVILKESKLIQDYGIGITEASNSYKHYIILTSDVVVEIISMYEPIVKSRALK